MTRQEAWEWVQWWWTYRAMRWLTFWRQWLPRCAAPPPASSDGVGIKVCCMPRGHEKKTAHSGAVWHADGEGFIFTDSVWRWMGPVSFEAYYLDDEARTGYVPTAEERAHD